MNSYARGRPTEDSDIDLFIVKDTDDRTVDRCVRVKRLIYDSQLRIPVSPLVYTPHELRWVEPQRAKPNTPQALLIPDTVCKDCMIMAREDDGFRNLNPSYGTVADGAAPSSKVALDQPPTS
jgi:hypothetical protein